jgi:hypothetical protein
VTIDMAVRGLILGAQKYSNLRFDSGINLNELKKKNLTKTQDSTTGIETAIEYS